MKQMSTGRRVVSVPLVAALVAMIGLAPISAQVRAGRRGAVAKGDDGAVAAGPRGAAVKGEEGYAAAGRRGAVVSGEEGYAAVGRHGNVVTGEEVDVQGAAVGRRGAVVVGEEGAAAVGRYGGVVVGDRYESYEAWKAVAAVGAGIAIGTMLAKPPAAATTVVVASIHLLLSRQRVLHARDDQRHSHVSGRRASGGGDHHDAAGRLHERARGERDLLAVWSHVLHACGDWISGRRAEVIRRARQNTILISRSSNSSNEIIVNIRQYGQERGHGQLQHRRHGERHPPHVLHGIVVLSGVVTLVKWPVLD